MDFLKNVFFTFASMTALLVSILFIYKIEEASLKKELYNKCLEVTIENNTGKAPPAAVETFAKGHCYTVLK
jgi:predicted cobalt transporter CbtA